MALWFFYFLIAYPKLKMERIVLVHDLPHKNGAPHKQCKEAPFLQG